MTDNQKQIRRAWTIARASLVIAAFSWGIGIYGPAVMLTKLHEHRGWDQLYLSCMLSVHFIASAAAVRQLTRLHRHLGVAVVTSGGMAVGACGIVLWAVVPACWMLVPAALITGVAWALTGAAALTAIVVPWFGRDQGKALAYVFNGATLAGVIFAPALVLLIEYIGLVEATILVAFFAAGITTTLCLTFIPQRSIETAYQFFKKSPIALADDLLLSELRSQAFLSLAIASGLVACAQAGLLTHIFNRMSPGVGHRAAAFVLVGLSIGVVLGRLVFSRLVTKIAIRTLAALFFVGQSLATMLIAWPIPDWLAATTCLGLGLTCGYANVLPSAIARSEFLVAPSIVVERLVSINQLAAAVAPGLVGLLLHLTGSYGVPFTLLACLALMAAAILHWGGEARVRRLGPGPLT